MVANKPLTHTDKINFLPETQPYMTPFRESALRRIFDAARELAPFQITEALVEINEIWEPDSWTLDLTLRVDSDMDGAHWLNQEIGNRYYPGWRKEFTEDELADFVSRVYFGVMPESV